MKKKVTSQDVADYAGVSRTTVSFVLNNVKRFSISPKTAAKVRNAAKELGYVPNASARALASQRAKAIGLIMTRSPEYIATDPFLPQILGGLLDVVKQNGLGLLVEWVEPGQQLRTYLELTRARQIDGMIVMTPREDDTGLKALEEAEIPAVLMGYIPGSNLYSVDIDNVQAAKAAVEHLIELGHERIACITNAARPYTSANQRYEGYKAAIENAGLAFDESFVRYADFNGHSGYDRMKSLLNNNLNFTAVFVASDSVAFGAMAAIRDAGLRIPEDISIVGFDDIPMASYVTPNLTTIQIPAKEIAEQSCHLLMQLMQGDLSQNRAITLPTQLIIRQSTAHLERRP
jgi:DNA-binding LacI/PurR family transcriptional regulator